MKKLIVLLVVFAFILTSGVSFAKSGYNYDYRTGNSYNYNTNPSGGGTVRGYNTRTGSTWNTNVDRSGNMRGTDSKGNQWNYNKSSGAYHNYGTGKSCYGKGANRVCY